MPILVAAPPPKPERRLLLLIDEEEEALELPPSPAKPDEIVSTDPEEADAAPDGEKAEMPPLGKVKNEGLIVDDVAEPPLAPTRPTRMLVLAEIEEEGEAVANMFGPVPPKRTHQCRDRCRCHRNRCRCPPRGSW